MAVAAKWAALACICVGGMGVKPGGGVSGMVHSPLGVRSPRRRSESVLWMVTSSLVKVAVHPASHSWPMEMRELAPWLSAGKRWAAVAVFRREGKGRWAVWVEVMVSPFGRWTVMGFSASCWCVLGASVVKKWPMVPVSANAVWGVELFGGEGPSDCVVTDFLLWFNVATWQIYLLSLIHI